MKTKCCGYELKRPNKWKGKICPHCGTYYPMGVSIIDRCRRAFRAFWRAFWSDPVKAHRTVASGETMNIPNGDGSYTEAEHME